MKRIVGMDYYGSGNRKGINLPSISNDYTNSFQQDNPKLISSQSAILYNKITPEKINHQKDSSTNPTTLLHNYQRYLNPTRDFYNAYYPISKPCLVLKNRSARLDLDINDNNNINESRSLQSNNKIKPLSNDKQINLKNVINPNIYKPNLVIMERNNKTIRRIKPPLHKPNFDMVKSQTFLESTETPEYLRQYDKEEWKNIDQYYRDANEERLVLSKMNNWIIKDPVTSQRNKNYFNQINDHSGQISKGAPEWMRRRPDKSFDLPKIFRKYQYISSTKDGSIPKTTLIDMNQSTALPNYLMETYKRDDSIYS